MSSEVVLMEVACATVLVSALALAGDAAHAVGLLGTVLAQPSASLEITPTNPVVGQVVTAIYTTTGSPKYTHISWGDGPPKKNRA